jgi:hypothetical protein
MKAMTRRTCSLFLVLGLAAAPLLAACEDDSVLLNGRGFGSPTPGSPADIQQKKNYAKQLFSNLEPKLKESCGKQCHEAGAFKPEPPKFLAGPDTYATITAHPGIVVKDVFQSTLLTKGAHAGPALGATPDLETATRNWLNAEAAALESVKLPGTEPFTVKSGSNEVDVSAASEGKLTGVKIKFDASLIGGVLSLKNLKLVAPAGTDVHVHVPHFSRVPVKGAEVDDESFSNLDQIVQQGTEASLGPGAILLSGDGWTPFDLAGDKLRFSAEKLEKGVYTAPVEIKKCKDAATFRTAVLPALRGGFNINCANCHGNGLSGLTLNGNDNQAICDSVLGRVNTANVPQSSIITTVTGTGPHSGGKVNDAAGFTAVFVDNKAVF